VRRLALWLAAACIACTPALNWRTVALGPATFLLPCKPDRGQRPVQLDAQEFSMEMAGCEAAGALYAVSRIATPAGTSQQVALRAWYAASLAKLGDTRQVALPAPAMLGGLLTIAAEGSGKQRDGSVLQARFRWVLQEHALLLWAVYAPVLSTEMTDPFFSEIKIP
jgi:hypothetical protein